VGLIVTTKCSRETAVSVVVTFIAQLVPSLEKVTNAQEHVVVVYRCKLAA